MQPEPPRVTVTNPAAPTSDSEVLEGGREPWRPTYRQVVVAACVALVVAVAAGTAALAQHAQRERDRHARELALVRAAVAAVSISAHVATFGTPADETPTPGQVELTNDGPDRVELVSATLSDGKALPVAPGTVLLPGVPQPYQLDADGDCARSNRSVDTVALVVRVRGQRVEQTVQLPRDDVDAAGAARRLQCRTGRPSEALATGVGFGERHGDEVWVKVDLDNQSVLPITIRSIISIPGVLLRTRPVPFRLAPAPRDNWASFTTVTLKLRVVDCERLLGVGDSGVGLDAENPYERELVEVDLQGLDPRFIDEGKDALSMLRATCRH